MMCAVNQMGKEELNWNQHNKKILDEVLDTVNNKKLG